jgi:hypothetical protein
MILASGSPDALSFTDATSLPMAGAKVSAQVIRELPLDWFFTLLQRAPNHIGELKSNVVGEVFFSLPEYERRKILVTLKAVRIHITDPQVYTYDVDEILSDIVPGGNVSDFISRLDTARQRTVQTARRQEIARRMLRDAPPEQIKLKHLVLEYQSGLRIQRRSPGEPPEDEGMTPYVTQDLPKDFDFTPFERRKKNMVNVLAGFLSKSESVFCDAVDILDEIIEYGTQAPPFVAFQLSKTLSASHAFDTGDSKEVQWIDSERKDVMCRIDRHGIFSVSPQPLTELDSRECFWIQAADFAAGIAREILHRKDLVQLVAAFDYVTYNGKRLSESKAIALTTDLAKRKANMPEYVQ